MKLTSNQKVVTPEAVITIMIVTDKTVKYQMKDKETGEIGFHNIKKSEFDCIYGEFIPKNPIQQLFIDFNYDLEEDNIAAELCDKIIRLVKEIYEPVYKF